MNHLSNIGAPTRVVVAGGRDLASPRKVYAALDAVHARQHITALVLMAPMVSPSHLPGGVGTHDLARRWAERHGIKVQSWLFSPTKVALEKWLAFECCADVLLLLPGEDYGLMYAARRLGLTTFAADGRTEVLGRARCPRITIRGFPPRMRPGRALSAAA